MTGNNLKEEILKTVDDNLIPDNSKAIKSVYLSKKAEAKPKRAGWKWGVLGGALATATACAIVIPILANPSTSAADNMPKAVAAQTNDISFGVASMSDVLSSSFAKSQETSKLKALSRPGDFGPGPKWNGPQEEDTTNYLTSVEAMYDLAKPYLPTVDNLLNGAEFEYQVENSGNEEYPYKIGNFIFNIVEDETQEGEITEEDPEKEDEGEGEVVPSEQQDPEENPEENEEEPDFTFIDEFYYIEGQLTVDEEVYPVTGQQITFAVSYDKANAQYSELYLNALKDETHEITIYKSTYSDSFTNSFKETNVSSEYEYESYAYTENELVTKTGRRGEYIERKAINAVEIQVEHESQTVGEKNREDTNVYLALESSYLDEEEIENSISADMSFRLPQEEQEMKPRFNISSFFQEEEEPTTEEPEVEEVEEETEPTKAFRVDYECKVEKDTAFELEKEYGHGQRGFDYFMAAINPRDHDDYTTVYGTFYVYKDTEGNLLDPDFETNGRHQVIGNGGYQHDWYDIWSW